LDLELKHVDPLFPVTPRTAEAGELPLQALDDGTPVGYVGDEIQGSGSYPGVKKVDLPLRYEEGLMVVLTMEVYDQCAKFS